MPLPASQRLSALLAGDGLAARALRSSAWTVMGFGASQAVRLAANLVLTRLLFPEAFGLMTLVTVFLVGLAMLSDTGVGPGIVRSPRGDEPAFLDTAWTIQVLRGVVLALATWAIAAPAAAFYGEPMLAELLPVAGLGLLVAGFNPTRLETANRHLALGRVVILDLASQVIGILVMVALAWWTRSVWALVAGGLVQAAAKLALAHALLPGHRNRFGWEGRAARELVGFGKWIFLSTTCGFLIAQGDKAILGKYVALDLLGIYGIAFFLATFPTVLGTAVVGRILLPLYRETPPGSPPERRRKLRLLRAGLSAGLMALLALLALLGPAIVDLLYDPRYAAAGPLLVLIACIQLPLVVGLTYDQAALAAGDSRGFFLLFAARGIVQVGGLLVGAEAGGLLGALAGQAAAALVVHPMIVLLARRHRVWDPLHDAVFLALALPLAAGALVLHQEAIGSLAALAG